MGEANRRKKLDPNWGKTKPKGFLKVIEPMAVLRAEKRFARRVLEELETVGVFFMDVHDGLYWFAQKTSSGVILYSTKTFREDHSKATVEINLADSSTHDRLDDYPEFKKLLSEEANSWGFKPSNPHCL
jgi:hypothetical protein